MEGRGPIKNYTREELLRYLQGKMSPAEMHRLEKDALEDPFLADALEGLQEFSSSEPSADFRKLDEQWNAHRKPGVIPMYRQNWFRAAAAILLLLGLGLVANQLFNREADLPNGIAQTKEKSAVSDSGDLERMEAKSVQGDSANGTTSAGSSQAPSPSGQPLAIADPRQPGKPNAGAEAAIEASPGKNSQEMTKSSGQEEKTVQQSAEAPPPPVSVLSSERNQAKKEQPSTRDIAAAPPAPEARRAKSLQPMQAGSQQGAYLYTGQVTDTDNRPLSFVNLRIPNSGLNTYTDARGYYRIMAGDSAILLELKATGYALRKAELSASRPGEKITMLPVAGRQKSTEPKASAREEMTKLDEDSSKEEDARPEVEPADGWAAYQYYLLNNLRMPADAAQQKLHGTVEVSFLVTSDGKRSGYRVEKSLSPTCDREALRLLREGPAWITYNSEQPLRARVTVVF